MLKAIWDNFSRYIKISKKESQSAVLFGIIGAFLETFSIYLLANLITNLGDNEKIIDIDLLSLNYLTKNTYIFLFLISAILSAFTYYISNKNIVKAKCTIEKFVREEITNLTLNIRWEYYLQISQGDISKSIISEGQNIAEGYMYFLSAITYSLIALTYFFVCLILVPSTFFILIIYAIFAFRIYIYYSRKADYYGRNLSNITSNIGKWTAAIFNNLKYLRAISKNNFAKQESKEIFSRFANSYQNAMVASYKSKFITEVLTIIFIFLSIVFIFISGKNAENLILSLSLFVRMTPKVYNSQSRFLDSLAMVSWPKLHNEKIRWAKNYSDFYYTNKDNFKFKGDIVFKSVCFNYPESKKILKNINLTIGENECLGITGKSGIGKSTFLDLITGIIKPKSGKILLSGENIENININLWRNKIGIVMQENFFKNDTLVSNIALGKSINRKKVKEALVQANAWNFVNKLSLGIDEIIFDRGVRFSGGERQRLALARALYSNPKILLLDEPSTGLDTYSVNELLSSINKIKGSMIIIIISHKKEIFKICDRVLRLDEGGLEEI